MKDKLLLLFIKENNYQHVVSQTQHYMLVNQDGFYHIQKSTINSLAYTTVENTSINVLKLIPLSREHSEEYYFQSDYNFDKSKINFKNAEKQIVENEKQVMNFIYEYYLKSLKKERYPIFKRGDVVRIKYTEEDLQNEDLGMSGIVLSSPLSKLRTRLDEDFIFIDTLKNDRETCVVFNKNNKWDYLLHISYLEKKKEKDESFF